MNDGLESIYAELAAAGGTPAFWKQAHQINRSVDLLNAFDAESLLELGLTEEQAELLERLIAEAIHPIPSQEDVAKCFVVIALVAGGLAMDPATGQDGVSLLAKQLLALARQTSSNLQFYGDALIEASCQVVATALLPQPEEPSNSTSSQVGNDHGMPTFQNGSN
jgi:hypothetical protein